jgi:hypothetical protein
MLRSFRLIIAAGLLIGCASQGGGTAGLSIKDEMKTVVEPASNLLFAVQGEVDPANQGPPAPAARWTAAADAAGKLKTVALSMTDPARAKDTGQWVSLSQEMGEAADKALKAARAHDGAGFSDAVNAMSDNCAACHGKYKAQTG